MKPAAIAGKTTLDSKPQIVVYGRPSPWEIPSS
jgi:hypothetical protein